MGFHHLALATRDVKATHEFYTGAMGFRLVKTVVGKAGENGFAKHLFYDTGGNGLMAFWDLHDPDLPADWSPAISVGLGLPIWTNHVAFDARDLEDLEARKRRWLDHGIDVMQIDHGWCVSIYARDPNGVLVEFCTTTAEFTRADQEAALRLLADPAPELEPAPPTQLFRASRR
jgi:catechol 2,3-dioxygenase-like lactoylglutathione lyase family enzyme